MELTRIKRYLGAGVAVDEFGHLLTTTAQPGDPALNDGRGAGVAPPHQTAWHPLGMSPENRARPAQAKFTMPGFSVYHSWEILNLSSLDLYWQDFITRNPHYFPLYPFVVQVTASGKRRNYPSGGAVGLEWLERFGPTIHDTLTDARVTDYRYVISYDSTVLAEKPIHSGGEMVNADYLGMLQWERGYVGFYNDLWLYFSTIQQTQQFWLQIQTDPEHPLIRDVDYSAMVLGILGYFQRVDKLWTWHDDPAQWYGAGPGQFDPIIYLNQRWPFALA